MQILGTTRTPIRELFPLRRATDSPSQSSTTTTVRYTPTSHRIASNMTTTGSPMHAAAARPSTPTTASKSTVSRPPLGDATFLTQVQQGSPTKAMVSRCAATTAAPPSAASKSHHHQPHAAYSSSSPYSSSAATHAPPPMFASASSRSSHHLTPTNCAVSLLPAHPLQHSRPLLVLDLDETLVHASVETSDGRHDAAFVVEMGGQKINVYIKIRPWAEEFLRHVSTLFEVCVFTASLAPYADKVVDYLDPTGQRVHHRLYREHCTNVDGTYVKDLNLMGRRIERVAIVDNSPVAYSFHPENAIPITSWFHCKKDMELAQLMPLLQEYARCGDFFAARSRFEKRGCFPLCA